MFVNNTPLKDTLGQAWIECMRDIVKFGTFIHDGDKMLLEICNYYMSIKDISEDDYILRSYADGNRISLMKEKYSSCNILPGYKISYGKLILNNQGINQIEWVIKRLKEKPETKSATITMHIPGENNLSCLSLLDFKLRDGRLNMSVVYRSQNVFSSQPGNFIALSGYQHIIAEALKADVGVIEAIILSAHIYENDILSAKQVLRDYDIGRQK